jgi:hypothetical protein
MARIFFFFYHALAPIQLANHSDFFNTHRRLHSEPIVGVMAIFRQPLTNGLSDHVWSREEIALLAN